MRIPKPFLPVTVETDGLSYRARVLGREMTFGANSLVKSIKSNGKELLSERMRFGTEDGEPIIWDNDYENNESGCFVQSRKNDKVVLCGAMMSKAFIINTAVEISYDGCVCVDASVMPRGLTVAQVFGTADTKPMQYKLDKLWLEIPKSIFLDYVAVGKNYPEKVAQIVSGVAEGCVQAGCALIGGETAEMPGFYPIDEYDLAGFAVGVVDEKDIITGADVKAGDVLIGMASTGVHSNGFSLVRKVFEKELNKEGLETYYEELGTTLGEALLAPTRIYVKALKAVKNAGVTVKACSHITGGGFYENVPRMLKDGVRAVIKKDSYQIPPIFGMLAKKGDIEEHMMYNTYNMGIGMVVAVDAADAERAMEAMKSAGDTPYIIGSVEAGEKGVTLC